MSDDRSRLFRGDCREIMKDLATGSIDAIVTDPPYEISLNVEWDRWPDPAVWVEMARVLKPAGHLAFSIAPHVADERLPAVKAAGFKTLEVGFWVYGSGRPVSSRRLRRNYDLIYFMSTSSRELHPENARLLNKSGSVSGRRGLIRAYRLGRQYGRMTVRKLYNASGVQDYFPSNVACLSDSDAFGDSNYPLLFAVKRLLPINRAFRNHPTQKPIDLLGQIVKLCSQPGEVVLDPFMGSGAIGVAALILDRRFVGVEINAGYYEMAERNIGDVLAQPSLWPSTNRKESS